MKVEKNNVRKRLKRVGLWVSGVCMAGAISACGAASTTSSDSGSATGGTDTTSGGSGFEINGTLASANPSVSRAMHKSASSSASITDVVAVSPSLGNSACKTAAVDADGAFSLSLDGNKPWLFYFIDHTQTGQNMYVAHLSSDDLDTVTPLSETGSLDVGDVSVDGSSASASITHSAWLSGLGLDATTADTLGAIDDVAERYSNPDVDGNGIVDCVEEHKQFNLDFHVRFNMVQNGTQVSIADIIDHDLDTSSTTAVYTGTGIYVSYPDAFSSVNTGTARFVNSAVTTMEEGALAINTATTSVTNNDYGDMHSFGPNIVSTSELPNGEAVFTVGDHTLDFINILTPTLAQLNAPTGRIFPFIKLTKTDATCVSNCTLASVDYRWMQKTADGWELASLEAVTALVVRDGATISIRLDNDADKGIQISLPKTSVSGSILWDADHVSLQGVTAAQLTAATTTEICHFGLSYDDQLGMRYFAGISDAPGTCP